MTLSQLRDCLLALELPDVDVTVRPGVVVLERGQERVQARVQVAVPGGGVATWCLTWAGGGVWGDRAEALERAVVLALRNPGTVTLPHEFTTD